MQEEQTYGDAERKAGEQLANLILAVEDAARAKNGDGQAAAVIRAAHELGGMLAAIGVPAPVISSAIFANVIMQLVQQRGGEATVDKLVRTADLIGPLPSFDQAKLIVAEVAGSA